MRHASKLAVLLLALFAVLVSAPHAAADDEDGVRQAILDKTASAKLTAHWGVDSFHLAKIDGQWRIVQVLWQSLVE